MPIIQEVQNEEYHALCIIADICKKNELQFFLRGGSALGAIKYHDFVPWDDDIDIALPRKDYNKLIEVMPFEFADNLLFVSYQNVKNAHCYFPRIVLKDSEREKKGLPKNNERGLVLIDVLPIDGMPDNRISLTIHIIKAYILRILASLWTIDAHDTVSMHGEKKDKLLKLLYSTKIHHLYKQDDIYRKLDKLYSRYPYLKTAYSGMLSSDKLKKEIMPSTWWGTGTKAKFRDLEADVPERYDLYLKRLFGDNYADYEPEENKRTKSHLSGRV